MDAKEMKKWKKASELAIARHKAKKALNMDGVLDIAGVQSAEDAATELKASHMLHNIQAAAPVKLAQ